MPLIAANCTNCGAALNVDSSLKSAVCPYCNTPYIVEKAVNNYHVVNNVQSNSPSYSPSNEFIILNGEVRGYSGNDPDIYIPSGPIRIKGQAFMRNAILTNVSIPSSVEEVGYDSFYGCKRLKKVIIPSGTKVIESNAFKECEALEEVLLSDTLEKMGIGVFDGCKSLKRIELPGSLQKIEQKSFFNCTALESVVINDGVKSIESSAFYNCQSLREITLPSTLECIQQKGIAINPLRSITLPESLRLIMPEAFYHCEKLEKIVIPQNVRTISSDAFRGCFALKDVTLLGGCVKTSAFYTCKLEKLVIGDNVYIEDTGDDGSFFNAACVEASDEWIKKYKATYKKFKTKNKKKVGIFG